MLESEFKIFDSIMKSIPKTEIAIIPQQTPNQIAAQQPQAGILYRVKERGDTLRCLPFSHSTMR
jgi:hypothetical protein